MYNLNMQIKRNKNINKEKRDILLKAVGEIIHEKRLETGKGLILHSYEYDLSSNSLDFIEKGIRDPQLTTLWKIVNSFNMTFSEFISILGERLPKNFKMTD